MLREKHMNDAVSDWKIITIKLSKSPTHSQNMQYKFKLTNSRYVLCRVARTSGWGDAP